MYIAIEYIKCLNPQ